MPIAAIIPKILEKFLKYKNIVKNQEIFLVPAVYPETS